MIVSASTLTPRKPAQPKTNEAAGDSQTFQTAVQAAQSNATNQGSSGSIQRVRQDIAAWNYQQSHSAHNKSFNLKGIQSDLVSTLRNAANAHQINDVLSQLNSSELATVGRILDQHGSTGSAAGARGLSQRDRNALFASMAQNGASGTNLGKLAKSLGNGADVAGVLTAASNTNQIDQLLGGSSPSDLNALEQKLDGTQGGSALSQNDRNALFTAMAQHGVSAGNLAKLTNSFTNGADVAGLLTAASNAGQINQVMEKFSPNQLNTVAQELDGTDNQGNPVLSQSARNALFSTMINGVSTFNGGTPATVGALNAVKAARFAKALISGADVSAFLTDVSQAGDISSVLSQFSRGDVGTLAQKIEGNGPYSSPDNNPYSFLSPGAPALFNAIAQGGATSGQLALLTSAPTKSGDIEAAGSAVANYSLPGTQVAYIKSLAPETTRQNSIGRADSIAVGTVLASLKGRPQEVDQAFNSLNSNQQNAVIGAAEWQTGYTGEPVNNSTALLDGIINSAATGTDPAMKARVFSQGITAYTQVNGSGERNQVLSALTNLLESNPEGVVDQLYDMDNNGPLKDSSNGYQHAQNLGYFVGCMVSAIQNCISNRDAQLQTEDTIIGGTVSVLRNVDNPYVKIAAPIAGTALELYLDNAIRNANAKDVNAKEAFYNTALYSGAKDNPKHEITGEPWSAFDEGYSDVSGTQTFG